MADWEVIFWDVGQGDATTIRLSDGSYILIDTGPKAKKGNPISRWFAEHGDAVIRKVIITHNHRDHFGGLISLLEAGRQIEEVLLVPDRSVCQDLSGIDFQMLMKSIGAHVQAGSLLLTWFNGAPYELCNDGALRLVALRPQSLPLPSTDSPNVTSMVIQLESLAKQGSPIVVWGGDALLGDVQKCVSPSHPEIVVGPHHGQPQDQFKAPDEWKSTLATFYPGCLYVSVGTSNTYQHPQKLYLFSAAALGVTVCCSEITPRCGLYRPSGQDVYPGSMMLGIRKPFNAVECRGSMLVHVSSVSGLHFDECQPEFLEAVKAVENRYCKRGQYA